MNTDNFSLYLKDIEEEIKDFNTKLEREIENLKNSIEKEIEGIKSNINNIIDFENNVNNYRNKCEYILNNLTKLTICYIDNLNKYYNVDKYNKINDKFKEIYKIENDYIDKSKYIVDTYVNSEIVEYLNIMYKQIKV